MTHPISKETLADYLLDALEEEKKKAVELAIENDEKLRASVESLRSIADKARLAFDGAPEDMKSLSDEQRGQIRKKIVDASEEAGETAEQPRDLFDTDDSKTAPVNFSDPSASLLGPGENGSDLFAPGGEPAKTPVKTSLVGERSEDSVLFSQRNLQNAVSVSHETTETRKDDTSGLVDIRALAQVAAAQNGDDTDGALDLTTGGFAPVLTPQIQPKKPWLIIALVGAGLLCVILVTVVMNLMFAGKAAEIAQLDAKLEQLNAQIAEQQAANGTGDSPETAALLEEIAKLKAEKAAREKKSGKGKKKKSTKTDDSTRSPAVQAPSDSKGPAPAGKKGATDDLDDLLGGATKAPSGKKKSDLPDTLTKKQVKLGLAKVAARVKRCGKGESGTLRMMVVITGSTGRVKSATATGRFKDTSVGKCAERAVKKARFHDFKKKTLTVTYPFQF